MSNDGDKIFSLMFAMGRRMRDEGRNRKLNSSYSILHFQTLKYVEEEGRPPMRGVAKYLCVTPPAATLLVDGMVKDRLLTRSFDPSDRRTVRIMLTEQGKKFIARGIKEKTDKLKELFSALTPKERAQFVAMLEKIFKKNFRTVS